MNHVSCQFWGVNKFPELIHLSAVIPRTFAGMARDFLALVANFKPEMGVLYCFCTFVARSPDRPSGFVVSPPYLRWSELETLLTGVIVTVRLSCWYNL